jgi:hypothetical protein
MKDEVTQVFKIAGGDIEVWVDPAGSICLKARNRFDDPIELGEQEALSLSELLARLVMEQQQ